MKADDEDDGKEGDREEGDERRRDVRAGAELVAGSSS